MLFSFVILERVFKSLLPILLNDLRNLFINVDTDEMLLLEKNKGIEFNSFTFIFLSYSCKCVLISEPYLAK